MLRHVYHNYLSTKQKYWIKQKHYELNKIISDTFFAYDTEKLKESLFELGIKQGDTLLVHSALNNFNGFQGPPQNIVKCLINITGPEGNLLMVSMPYTSSTYEYLQKKPVFNVKKTVSKMGIITEIFRRKKEVLRSLHPTHPVLAWGKDEDWITKDHDKCIYPCGKDTPFDKFRSLEGKILFFDVAFRTCTFIHHIEDLIKDRLPFELYTDKPMSAEMIDHEGNKIVTDVYVFGDDAVKKRSPEILEDCLVKENLLKKTRIGKTSLILVTAEDAINCTYRMLERNSCFYVGVDSYG